MMLTHFVLDITQNSTPAHNISALLSLVRLRQIVIERQIKHKPTTIHNVTQIYARFGGLFPLDVDKLQGFENRSNDSVFERSRLKSKVSSSDPKVGSNVIGLSLLKQYMGKRSRPPLSDLDTLQLTKTKHHRKCILNAMVIALKRNHNYSEINNHLVNKSKMLCFK